MPDELLSTLSWTEFQILRDGEVNEARAGRDLCLGFFGSGLFGSIGLVNSIEWGAAFHQAHWAPFIWTGLAFVIVGASGVGALIYHSRCRHMLNNSAYSSLMRRLADQFSGTDSRTPSK
jgi:hypothetical protein